MTQLASMNVLPVNLSNYIDMATASMTITSAVDTVEGV